MVYVTGNDPTPDVTGQKVFPETPVPDQEPVPKVYVLDGVNVAHEAPAQKGPGATNAALYGFVTVITIDVVNVEHPAVCGLKE